MNQIKIRLITLRYIMEGHNSTCVGGNIRGVELAVSDDMAVVSKLESAMV